MTIRIGAFGYGLAAICGAGAILLAALNNSAWTTFLIIAAILFVVSIIARKM